MRRNYAVLRLAIVVQRRWWRTGVYHRWLPHTRPEPRRFVALYAQLRGQRSIRECAVVYRRRPQEFMARWPLLRRRIA
jgi:hypothetical protein